MQASSSEKSDSSSGILSKAVNFALGFLSSEESDKSELNVALERFGTDAFFQRVVSNLRPILSEVGNYYLSAADYINIYNQSSLEERLSTREEFLFRGYNYFTFENIDKDKFPFANYVLFKFDRKDISLEGKYIVIDQLLKLAKPEDKLRIQSEISKVAAKVSEQESDLDDSDENFSEFPNAIDYSNLENLYSSDSNSDPTDILAMANSGQKTDSTFATLTSAATPVQSTSSFLNPEAFSTQGFTFPQNTAGTNFGSFATVSPTPQAVTQAATNPSQFTAPVTQFNQPPVQPPVQPMQVNPAVPNMQTLALALQQLMGQGNQAVMTEWGPLNQAPSKAYVEQPKFDEIKTAAGTSVRQPKNMKQIFAKFHSFFDSAATDTAKLWPEAILKGLYVEYVLGAKDKKAQLKSGGKGWQKIPYADESTACIVIIGKPNQGLRTDLSATPPVFTYPDFCACIVIEILFFAAKKKQTDGSNYKSDLASWSPAPLAANIKNERPEYLDEGYHLCGHSGLPSMVNYFWTKKKENAHWGPLVGNLVEMGVLMDAQSKGNLGKNATKEQIARTCGAPANALLQDAWKDKWVVMAQTTQAARTAADLLSAQSTISVQMMGQANPFSGTNPVGNQFGASGAPSV